jgi:antitoxin MazE
MSVTLTKWGNSLAIRIPQHLAKQIHVVEGSKVDLDVVDGNLIVKPSRRKRYSLSELVDKITPENLHAEIDTGASVGKEVW